MDEKWLLTMWHDYRGRAVGAVAGLLLGILFLFFGFWRTLFLTIIAGVGFLVGKQVDGQDDWKKIVEKIQLDRWMNK